MKTCSKCKQNLSLDSFHNNKNTKDGKETRCKTCRLELAKRYRKGNRELLVERSRKYRRNNLEKVRKKDRERSKNPNRRAYLNARNRYHLVKSKSLGGKFNDETILIYEVARFLSEYEGKQFEVDHIEPLQGNCSSGLHVPWNL